MNQTCMWYLNTTFDVSANMPECLDGGCMCAWFWIHSDDSSVKQMYMNGFHCDITGIMSTTPIGMPMLSRQFRENPDFNEAANLGDCTIWPRYPMYWMQAEQNNMHTWVLHAASLQ
ncbi:uncharacterized protein LAESUDRAFT_781785 [Laetiporus sulphureus 93-53]|uniref:Uncharacterized protein n=1 Tax=Laetiporus sulphureus 93-53 TaxID=1314785 RepID=A0A165DM52_9APHY|nr:uncharacterized protein LAESUDRAFT_781785 [Laetiporus sulphureus 93-53]KZT05179.1 hypothetical protein LAESUDRAFT_781785 [Laetiporus sulphureus 93-53]